MTGNEIATHLLNAGITPKTVTHRNYDWIALEFNYDTKINEAVKSVTGRRWSKTLNCWLIPKNKKLLENLLQQFKNLNAPEKLISENNKVPAITVTVKNTLSATVTVHKMPDWLGDYERQIKLRAYSYNTLRSYRNNILQFYNYFSDRDLKLLPKVEIEKFMERLHDDRKFSPSAMNMMINSIKFLFEKVWAMPRDVYSLPRAKKPKQLPKFFQQSEIEKIFSAVSNVKHKIILYTAYSAGLRVGEICKLKLTDIMRQSMILRIEAAKGKKDRTVNLSPKVLILLEEYYKKYKPAYWLFEGPGGEPYSTRSIQIIFQQAKAVANIKRQGGVHSLRHSFATHLMESGIDVRIIQELLGHNDLRTTLKYAQVTDVSKRKIESPLDKLNL